MSPKRSLSNAYNKLKVMKLVENKAKQIDAM